MTNASPATAFDTASILAALGAKWRSFSARLLDSDGLGGLTQADVELIAQDIGLRSDDLYDLAAKGGHAADEAPMLMHALGLNPEALQNSDHATYADILVTCTRCQDKRRCASDVDHGTADQHFAEYCANADTLNALRAIAATARR